MIGTAPPCCPWTLVKFQNELFLHTVRLWLYYFLFVFLFGCCNTHTLESVCVAVVILSIVLDRLYAHMTMVQLASELFYGVSKKNPE